MKVSYARYELEPCHLLSAKSSNMKREGALLKVVFDSFMTGYADCFAWPELGDLSLSEQLDYLAQGKYTPLTLCAMEFAALDAKSRWEGKSIFRDQYLPRSHFLVTDIFKWNSQHVERVIQQGYTHVKLKVGRHIDREIECLHTFFGDTPLKLRLDFNETLTSDSFNCFLKQIQKMHESIDFIEDPFPFHVQSWTAIQKDGWTLACDRQAQVGCHHPEATAILIVKPALQPFEEWQKWMHRTCIVTSYLGHPMGQVAAAYVASQIDPSSSLVHGLLSHHVYQPNSFSRLLNWDHSSFTLPAGNGFGFDHELSQLEWISLKEGRML